MKERVLIIGYNGELGSKTLKKLLNKGKSVIALDISDPKEKIHSVTYIKDTITNYRLINSIFKDYHITEVYHFAALLSQTAAQNPELAFEINEKASKNDCSFPQGACTILTLELILICAPLILPVVLPNHLPYRT